MLGYGGDADSAVSLSSTAHKRTVHMRNACVCGGYVPVCVCVEQLRFLFFLFTGGPVHLFVFPVLSGWAGDTQGG